MDSIMLSTGRGGFEATRKTRRSRRLLFDPFVVIAIALVLLMLAAFAFTGLISPSKANSGLWCGSYVTQDVKLDRDIFGCVDGGLMVGASNITVDLNGHTISGLGEGDGINMANVTGVTVLGGKVANFEVGIHLAGVTNTHVWDTQLSGNSDASVWAELSSNNKFRRMSMTQNGDGGFRLIGSHKNRIAGSTIAVASDSGIMLEGLSSHNRLVRNNVTLAGEGIKVEGGTGNRVFRNTTSRNGGAGIEVSSEAVATRVRENKAHWNGADGIFNEGTGTQVLGNRAGCNGGMGIKSSVLAAGGENWAGGNGDNLGCDGVVCRLDMSCGTE
jgi:parallel beta-helix repeat protein